MSVTFAAIDATTFEFAADIEDINMNNANAAFVLESLGFAEDVAAGDLCGTVPAQDFLGRVLAALALSPGDEGVPAHTVGSDRFIDCGRRPGYLQDRLAGLHELALAAQFRDLSVTWA